MTTRKEQTKGRRGSVILPPPQRRTSLGPTTEETVIPNISSAGKKAKRSASVFLETPFVDQRESQDDASIISDESMADGLRVEIEQLRKMLEQVHFQLHEQGMVIEQQRQEIHSLKAVYNDHETKINHLLVSPPPPAPINQTPSYKAALNTGLPGIASTVIKEQSERQKRMKNIIIKDKRHPKDSLIQPSTDPSKAVHSWLIQHGLTQQETNNLSVRVVANRQTSAPDPTPQYSGHTIIVTLPHVDNRFIVIGKIKRSIRGTADTDKVFVDADLTPTEAQEQYELRLNRNKLNSERTEAEKSVHHFGVRNGKVIKITH
jgi:hypothetical protein